MQIYRWRGRYLHGLWLAGRPRSIILLQLNPSFEEMLDQVHFTCSWPCWRATKYDVHILCQSTNLLNSLYIGQNIQWNGAWRLHKANVRTTNCCTDPALKMERHHQRWSSPDSWKYVSATATHAVTFSRIMYTINRIPYSANCSRPHRVANM